MVAVRMHRRQLGEQNRSSGANGRGFGRTTRTRGSSTFQMQDASRDVPRSRRPPLVPAVVAAPQRRYRRTRFRIGVPRVHIMRVLWVPVPATPPVVPDRWPEEVGGRHGHAAIPIVVLMLHHPLPLVGVLVRVLFARVCAAHVARRSQRFPNSREPSKGGAKPKVSAPPPLTVFACCDARRKCSRPMPRR